MNIFISSSYLSAIFGIACVLHFPLLINFCFMSYCYSTTYVHYRKFRNRYIKNPEITTNDLFVYILSDIFL